MQPTVPAHAPVQPTHLTGKQINSSVFWCGTIRDLLFLIISSLKLLHTFNVLVTLIMTDNIRNMITCSSSGQFFNEFYILGTK